MDLLISALVSCLFLKSEKQKSLHVTSQDWMGLQFFISFDLELSTPVWKQTLRRLLSAQPFPLSGALSRSVGALFLICICICRVQLGSRRMTAGASHRVRVETHPNEDLEQSRSVQDQLLQKVLASKSLIRVLQGLHERNPNSESLSTY